MSFQPGLLFAGQRETVRTLTGRVTDQSDELASIFLQGQLAMPHRLRFKFGGELIQGFHHPSLTHVDRSSIDDGQKIGPPETWVWHIHLDSLESDREFIRFYKVVVGPGDIIIADLIRIKRPPLGE